MFDFREHRRRQIKSRIANRRIKARLRSALAGARSGFWPLLSRAVPVGLILALLGWAGLAAVTGELFRVREVRVIGLERVPRAEVIGLLELKSDQHLFDVDLERLRSGLRRNRWIRDAEVTRELPDRLVVRVREQRILAVARMEHDYYVNDEGFPFKQLTPGESRDYTLISGFRERDFIDGRPEALRNLAAAIELLKTLEQADVAPELSELSEVRYDPISGFSLITLAHGAWIDCGRGGFEEKIGRLAALYAELKAEAGQLAWADVTVDDRAFIRLRTTKEGA